MQWARMSNSLQRWGESDVAPVRVGGHEGEEILRLGGARRLLVRCQSPQWMNVQHGVVALARHHPHGGDESVDEETPDLPIVAGKQSWPALMKDDPAAIVV